MSSAEEQDVQRLMGIANATAWMRPVAGLGATVTSFWRRPAFRCHHGGIASRSRSLQSNDGHRRRGYHGRGLWIEPREIRGTIALDQELSGLLASCTVRPNSRGVRRAGRERRSAKPHSVPDSQESVRLRVAARRGQASPAGATGHWEASETSQKGWAVPQLCPTTRATRRRGVRLRGRRRLCSCESLPALDEHRLGGESTRSGRRDYRSAERCRTCTISGTARSMGKMPWCGKFRSESTCT